ncbi:hypothetical protein A0R60_0988 [Enterobacter asburiae]|nr:hypothetical protein A0R60_0988 [Enterobacter asburiae]
MRKSCSELKKEAISCWPHFSGEQLIASAIIKEFVCSQAWPH